MRFGFGVLCGVVLIPFSFCIDMSNLKDIMLQLILLLLTRT